MLMFSPPAPAALFAFAAEPGPARLLPLPEPTFREQHARLLQIAAARRLRAAERASAARSEDAQYWKAVAPAALAKAAAIRRGGRLSPLPC